MADQEDDDFQMALKMSMQHLPPEAKRSKPRDAVAGAAGSVSSPEDSRRLQRELMAAAAEKRLLAARSSSPPAAKSMTSTGINKQKGESHVDIASSGRQLSIEEANQLFTMVFGNEVSENILARWTNQGIRFSPDPETSMGLVQHEGGPCGVLAAIQAFVLKYILFFRSELSMDSLYRSQLWSQKQSPSKYVAPDDFSSVADDVKTRALVRSMYEILLLCGSEKNVVIVTIGAIGERTESEKDLKDETITEALEGISIVSASDLHALLKFNTYTSQLRALQRLEAMIPVFRSRLGAMLFLFSALLSRGLDLIQADRDDPSLPLVTSPFGHASQEIVNLLLCGEAVPNVFDGKMDLGGGMSLKGVSRNVEVGFLTLLESLNFCKVGQYLKRPTWPIWVVGSESHYTVIFALDSRVQDENELEERESQIRKAFDAQDQSGGGGFISVEGFHQVLRETNVKLLPEKLDHLCSTGFIVWSEFWQVILDLDKTMGGLKDSSGLMGKKMFDLYHFNGIAKSDLNCSQASSGGETPMQRPRLTKLRVSVPPKWTPEEFMAEVSSAAAVSESSSMVSQTTIPEPPQHAPLVDCVRTRWPRAVCNWIGDPPSIV